MTAEPETISAGDDPSAEAGHADAHAMKNGDRATAIPDGHQTAESAAAATVPQLDQPEEIAAPSEGPADEPLTAADPPDAPSLPVDDLPETIIRPQSGWGLLDLVELWRYRDLLWVLALRDIKVRYKQTLIGAAWAIVQPLATMAIFATLFHLMNAQAVTAGVPYVVTTYAALMLWQLFGNSLTQSSGSLVSNQNLIKKVYCPRLVFPLSPIIAALIDFAVALSLLAVFMMWYGVVPGWPILCAPLFAVLAVITALAVGLWLSALSAMYRDFVYVVPFLVQVWMFVTPVVYETEKVVPERWRTLYFLNPMAGIVEGFRWSLFGHSAAPIAGVAISLVAVAVILVTGLLYFRRVENTLADWV